MSNGECNLKQALYQTLTALLSPDATVRQHAEQQVKVFEVTDEFGLYLTEIALDVTINWAVRQLASVLLKQYVSVHWSSNDDKFQPPVVNRDNKLRIKSLLIHALGQDCPLEINGPEKRLKSAVAYVISSIAHYDWPEDWPDLFVLLVEYLNSGRKSAVYGSMKVFVDISHEIIDTQIPTVAPLILPKMLEIFADSSNYSLRTRGRAVQIFTYISETIAVMGEYDKVSVKMYLDPVLPHFTEALVKVLQLPGVGLNEVDVGLKKDVLNCLTILIKHFMKRMRKWMPQILTPVWYSLTTSASLYVKSVVNSDAEENAGTFDNPVDSDGEVLSLENLVFALFDFVSILVENSKSRKLIKSGMSDLLYYLLIYMQISDEQMQAWSSNPDQFVEDEDDDSYSFSVRLSAQEILTSLAQEFEENESKANSNEFKAALVSAISKHFNESNQLKQQSPNNYFWWKIQESCLLALGSLSPSMIGIVNSQTPVATDLKRILDNVFMATTDASPFFAGRCLWAAARFAAIMSPPILDRFLQTTLSALNSQSPVYKITAIRATYAFAEHLKQTKQETLIKPYLQGITEALLITATQYSNEVLALSLETMTIILSIDDDFTASVEDKISPLAIATFVRHSADPLIIVICQDFFRELSKNAKCAPLTQQRLGPALVSILNPNQTDQSVITLQPVALDILTTMVRNSPLPLSPILMTQLFPAAAKCILSTVDDNATMQNGGECLRAYVSRAMEQIVAFKEPESNSDGLSILMQVCLHLLDPRVNESCAAFVGRLISIVITKAGSYLGHDNIHLLLRSVLSKLQTAETLSVIQSLIMVFSHLFNHEMTTVLDFLSSLPGPTGGQSALVFVLTHWLSRQHLFFGTYENKVCLLALCKLLEYSVVNFNNGDKHLNLNLIQVPGEPIIVDSATIVTRSKTRSQEVKWTTIPCSVKIFKLLVQEIRTIEENGQADESDDEDEDDEDDYEFDAVGAGNSSASRRTLQDLINDAADEYGDSEDEDDDIVSDPINKVNLLEHLVTFIRSFKTTPFYGEFYGQLNEVEQMTADKL